MGSSSALQTPLEEARRPLHWILGSCGSISAWLACHPSFWPDALPCSIFPSWCGSLRVTATDSFSLTHLLCRFLDGIIILCHAAHFIMFATCVRKFHPNESTSPGSISRLMVSCIFLNLTSISSCAFIPTYLPFVVFQEQQDCPPVFR